MRLTDHDLKQFSQEYLASLSPEQLLHLSKKMLGDLRDARDRLWRQREVSRASGGSNRAGVKSRERSRLQGTVRQARHRRPKEQTEEG